ncbi:DHHW family protein [Desulfosporosinus sp. OT]|uniref:DHHW family protein n=1 Tax=Desulfosporosinus sp. OT TaxID=913865 RepID=UPI0006832359|nr:DHHW family protein [Desulfosporosinus sp. OT]
MGTKTKRNLSIILNILSVFPLLFILAMFILHLALPDITFSKEERRYLAQWPPVFHIEGIIDGSYMTKVETYFSDQFPFRIFWVHIQKDSDQFL